MKNIVILITLLGGTGIGAMLRDVPLSSRVQKVRKMTFMNEKIQFLSCIPNDKQARKWAKHLLEGLESMAESPGSTSLDFTFIEKIIPTYFSDTTNMEAVRHFLKEQCLIVLNTQKKKSLFIKNIWY